MGPHLAAVPNTAREILVYSRCQLLGTMQSSSDLAPTFLLGRHVLKYPQHEDCGVGIRHGPSLGQDRQCATATVTHSAELLELPTCLGEASVEALRMWNATRPHVEDLLASQQAALRGPKMLSKHRPSLCLRHLGRLAAGRPDGLCRQKQCAVARGRPAQIRLPAVSPHLVALTELLRHCDVVQSAVPVLVALPCVCQVAAALHAQPRQTCCTCGRATRGPGQSGHPEPCRCSPRQSSPRWSAAAAAAAA
mmetsp:Transcript_70570/g.228785  ORF Transcript_70570/g.228785 Transcript_70570/m.228785 type:complete len:250 (+) Transcript_70570:1922-2671(+)